MIFFTFHSIYISNILRYSLKYFGTYVLSSVSERQYRYRTFLFNPGYKWNFYWMQTWKFVSVRSRDSFVTISICLKERKEQALKDGNFTRYDKKLSSCFCSDILENSFFKNSKILFYFKFVTIISLVLSISSSFNNPIII